MNTARFFGWSLAILLLLGSRAQADKPTATALAAQIDAYLTARWKQAGLQPAERCDDATFVRRIYLGLVGRIPTIGEARDFLADTTTDKRERLIDRLVASNAHARHMATFWRRTWLPQTDTQTFASLTDDFEQWAAERLQAQAPYDQLVRELLTVRSDGKRQASAEASGGATPYSFLVASERKPENLAANTARAFLGINLDCAQCHDHPFARWSREQFWQTAAFFALPDDHGSGAALQIKIAETERLVSAAVLTTPAIHWPEQLQADTGRAVLAKWIVSPENPYFAKNGVNRLWSHYFGRGLVEPLDDLSSDAADNHRALLDALAQAFLDSGYDLQLLSRAFTQSRAYQLASVGSNQAASDEQQLFAYFATLGLSGEQLHDSLQVVGGFPADRHDLQPEVMEERRRFVTQFYVQRPADAQRSILQSLTLMNGRDVQELTDAAATPLLVATAQAPFLDARTQVETLFFAAFSRKPTAEEAAAFVAYVDRHATTPDAKAAALADVFWVLLNSTEFNTNH
jgi:hypothetical protein